MALEITGTIELEGGLTTSTGYARLTADVNDKGNVMRTVTKIWTNKTNYDNGVSSVILKEPIKVVFDYNRQTDGDDLLLVAHNNIKTELESYGYSVVITDL
jgi:hypothetical protein